MTALTFMNASVLMAVVNYSFFDRLFLGDFWGLLGFFGGLLGTFKDFWGLKNKSVTSRKSDLPFR